MSKSDIFGVLQNDRRRNLLKVLRENNGQDLRTISEALARIESDAKQPVSNLRKSIYASLLQTHIPKMEKMGIITYDKEKDNVELTQMADDFDMYLETVEKGNIPWCHYYLGLGIFTIVGSSAVAIDLIDWVTGPQWSFFVGTMLLISSFVHVAHTIKLGD